MAWKTKSVEGVYTLRCGWNEYKTSFSQVFISYVCNKLFLVGAKEDTDNVLPDKKLRAKWTISLRQHNPSFGVKLLLSGFTKDTQWEISAEKVWTVNFATHLLNMHL